MFEFIKLREEHLEMVLDWRTREDVTKHMASDIEYNLDNQKKWFDKISNNPSEKYWIILCEGKPIGMISLNDIDYKNKHTKSGYYIGEKEYRIYGGIIPLYLSYYVFNTLGLDKIYSEVMAENKNMVKMHRFFGSGEVEILKDHIYKNNRYYDVYLFESTKEYWLKYTKNIEDYKANFEE